jgi:(5-formylfuran-3-yl)methyl phosphate synthase
MGLAERRDREIPRHDGGDELMTGMLASVTSVDEAGLAIDAGADVIDLKDPAHGALGALEASIAREIVTTFSGKVTLSATVGDLPAMDPGEVLAAARRTAELGVDFVKVGFFGTPRDSDCVRALLSLAAETRLIAVQFADVAPDLDLRERLAEAQFAGVMLDTARKEGPGLRELLSQPQLSHFVHRARTLGLIAGLAGKLRLGDIPALLESQPDYLGFRGALCAKYQRSAGLDVEALRAVRLAIPARESNRLHRYQRRELQS